MYKRMIGIFCVMVLLMTGLIYRIYYIDASDYITMAASVQGKYRMTVADTRGVIYDRNMRSLVNNQYKYVASVLPNPKATGAILSITPEEEKASLLERLSDGRPFAMNLGDNDIYAEGVDIFRVPERYGDTQYASHLIGYLSDGAGVSGIERAYEETLSGSGGEIGVVYQMDAAGRMMQDTAVAVERRNEEPVGGVVLSLDREFQEISQTALEAGCQKGAAVVLDIYTGDILAMASLPVFDQNNISLSLESEDAPFVNRATAGHNIGSVFKLLVASAALESGISQYHQYDCKGYIDVSGQIFKCNNDRVHGMCDMERALEVSCNSYFISLAQNISPEFLLSLSANMGLGKSTTLAEGITTGAGNLPALAELQSPAGYANFSFGQGSSLASPLQMAQAVAAIANTGMSVTPRLVRGITADGVTMDTTVPPYTANQVISERTSEIMRGLMVKVVEEGSGKPAKPLVGSAGGKTSSAQTGQYYADDPETEIVHAWFAGFYPAQKPRYSIVVFVEGGESGEKVAGPIFKQIADGISRLK